MKSPLELATHLFSLFEVETLAYAANPKHAGFIGWNVINNYSNQQGFSFFSPTSVNGYGAYSTGPKYDKNFTTSTTFRSRYSSIFDRLTNGITYAGATVKYNHPFFVKNSGHFSNPTDANSLVKEFSELLHVDLPTPQRLGQLKQILLGNLSEINWATEWNNYINTGTSTSVNLAIKRLVSALIKSPEFQIL